MEWYWINSKVGATPHGDSSLWYGQTNADGTISEQNGFVDALSALPSAAEVISP